MLPKYQRYSFSQGVPERGITTVHCSLRFRKTSTPLRIAIVVSKKVEKKATGRNLVKRRVSEAVHYLLREYNIQADLVLYARKPLSTQSVTEISELLKQLFRKAAII